MLKYKMAHYFYNYFVKTRHINKWINQLISPKDPITILNELCHWQYQGIYNPKDPKLLDQLSTKS